MLDRIVKMILSTSEGKIGRWKLIKKEKRTFVGGGCMHNQGFENKGALPFYRELRVLCNGDRVVTYRVV